MTVSLRVPEAAATAVAGDSRDLTVPAADGYALAATLLEPGCALPDAPLVVIGCAVGVPRRYSYSPNEVVDLNDLALAVRLLARFVRDMESHTDLGFV